MQRKVAIASNWKTTPMPEVHAESTFQIVALRRSKWSCSDMEISPRLNKWYEMRIEDALKHIDMASFMDILRQRELNQSNSI